MVSKKVYTLVAKDDKEMEDWFSTLEKVIAGEFTGIYRDLYCIFFIYLYIKK